MRTRTRSQCSGSESWNVRMSKKKTQRAAELIVYRNWLSRLVYRGGIMYNLATSFIYTKRTLFETRTREVNKVNTQNKQKQNVVTAWVTYSSYISHKNWFYTKKLELSLYFMITPLFLHPDTWHAWHVECWSVLSASEHRPSQPECKSGSEDSTHEPHTGHTGNSRMLL